jgi:hypothetical protein
MANLWKTVAKYRVKLLPCSQPANAPHVMAAKAPKQEKEGCSETT